MSFDKKYSSVGWGITDRCNLSCPHCYSSAVKVSDGELNTDECRRLIDYLGQVGVGSIGWTGGEPLLRKDLEDLIAHAHNYGIKSGITTNGVPLTAKRIQSLKKAQLSSLQISLDGSTADRNYDIRRASAKEFQLVIDGIKMSLDAGLPVYLAMIICRATLDDVLDYVEMAKELGVKKIRYCGFVPHGGGKDDEINRKMGFGDRLGDLADLMEKLVVMDSPSALPDVAFGPPPPAYDFHQCKAGVDAFYIASNGDVYPCTSLIFDRFKVGNVREQSLDDILSSPKMTEIASYPRENIEGHCRECPYFRVCRGACRGAVYAHTGNLNASFPTCLYRASRQ
ncbi:MAG: radical SAM protein [Candidatus Zixiibacteriota bacterium]|nr:MAG: radical SAM protein [candidate division Zixibacteria bacterium]